MNAFILVLIFCAYFSNCQTAPIQEITDIKADKTIIVSPKVAPIISCLPKVPTPTQKPTQKVTPTQISPTRKVTRTKKICSGDQKQLLKSTFGNQKLLDLPFKVSKLKCIPPVTLFD